MYKKIVHKNTFKNVLKNKI